MATDLYQLLFDLTVDHHGYFTAADASKQGVGRMAVVMMERRGTLERVSRGVYRLVHFPPSPNALYMEAALWPAGARGVISHESALALHDISDVSPARVHITVPRRFRVRRAIPAYLRVHNADLREDEVDVVDGVPVTTPERAIRDCHAADLGPEVIRQAIDDARRGGHLSARAADQLRIELLETPHPP